MANHHIFFFTALFPLFNQRNHSDYKCDKPMHHYARRKKTQEVEAEAREENDVADLNED